MSIIAPALPWPDRRLIDTLRIEHPIVLAPMAGFATPELAAAVCAGGGLGSIGCAALSPGAAQEAIARVRALSTRPINVNFFCHHPAPADGRKTASWHRRLKPFYDEMGLDSFPPATEVPPFDAAMCAIIEAARPEVVSFHFGLPAPSLLARVKAAGCRVMSSATTVHEARWLEERGADIIIAQGYEAGGHRAMFLAEDFGQEVAQQSGTMALVPQIVDAVPVPVIASGGIADKRGIAAALALGAAGVQLGTAYLLCPEAGTSALQRKALQTADADSTVVTMAFTGRPARALANRFTRETAAFAAEAPAFPHPMSAVAALRTNAEARGSTDFSSFWAGQAAPLAKTVAAEQLTRDLAQGAIEVLRHLAG